MANSLKEQSSELDSQLANMRQQFLDAENSSVEERRESAEARDYYDGKQWTEEEAKILRKRKQPVVVDNKIKDKIEYMLGMERKSRTDPKAYPRNQNTDEEQAEAATDALRFVCDDNLFNYVRSAFAEDIFLDARGCAEVIIDPTAPGAVPKILIRDMPMDRTYVDPHSRRCDYLDAGYKGVVIWMDEDRALEAWPNKQAEIEASFDQNLVNSDTYEDRPHFFMGRGTKRRIQVFEHYYLMGSEHRYCKFVAGGFLEDPRPSPYMDFETSKPGCPIEMQALYRERSTGNAYSLFRRYKDLQDEWNKRRSKALHLLNTKQIIGERGVFGADAKEVAKNRKEFHAPDGFVELVPGLKYDIINGLDLSQGHLNMMLMAGQSLQASGPNAALAGLSGDLSGRAKQLDQQGGLIAIDYPFDAVRYMTLRIYRQIWNRIKQYWTDEAWIRIRDEEQIKFVALNQRRLRAEVAAEALKTSNLPDEVKAQKVQEIALDPRMQEVVVQNPVAEIDVDITIDEVPDVMNLQQETFESLVRLAESGRVPIPPRALIEASPLRSDTKRKVLDSMSGAEDPMQQQMAALQMKVQELGAMLTEAKIREVMANVLQKEATAEETRVDSAIKQATFITQPATPKTSVGVN